MKLKLSTEWLSVCGGCHVAVVDLDLNEDEDALKVLKVLEAIEICHSPILTDVKDYPEVDIGIVSGAIRSDHDRETARKMRASCKKLIAFGTCAVYGGISGAGNIHSNDEIFDCVYSQNPTTRDNKKLPDPAKGIPRLSETVVPLDSVINVDIYLPGCPPHPYFISWALLSLLGIKESNVNYRNVCARCDRDMGKKEVEGLKRFIQGAPDTKTCFLSQGYLCFGSVTLDRCLAPCPKKGMVCTGCSGPSMQILREPNRDIRTEIAELVAMLTPFKDGIEKKGTGKDAEKKLKVAVERKREVLKEEVIKEIEKNSKTHYAYAMASDMIAKKPTFLIKKWINS